MDAKRKQGQGIIYYLETRQQQHPHIDVQQSERKIAK